MIYESLLSQALVLREYWLLIYRKQRIVAPRYDGVYVVYAHELRKCKLCRQCR